MVRCFSNPFVRSVIFGCVCAVVIAACSGNDGGTELVFQEEKPTPQTAAAGRPVNINTASAAELETLPYIGPKLARQVIEHRQTHGPFRKPEHLMLIPGMSDRRFRAIRHLISVE